MNPFALAGWAAVGAGVGAGVATGTRLLLRTGGLGGRETIASAAVTAVLFAGLGRRFGWGIDLAGYSSFTAVAVALALIDFVEQRLPGVLTFAGIVVLGGTFTLEAVRTAGYNDLLRAAAAMVVLAAGYLVLALALGGLGSGDVKLAGLLGLALGWQSWSAVLAGTVLGWLLAGIARALLRATGSVSRDAAMPLGPYLVLGALLAILGD
ncbi:prepilin peptidase [Amycolatopsis methanolica]|uniref:Leader peptidase (Prepilin peptidase)/N-methyltransferase n=1 Tax=Amycolatopsis methanolica 239 TaxID=1068978 RepID=A0A076MRF8_AMYME|nr:prepilin peptidase [Amycolatopsis methanolica]AIJ23219.1 leader peptidase (prepilin peptidase)/N-methyltransferase [Amycolatopsis methanolica 239]